MITEDLAVLAKVGTLSLTVVAASVFGGINSITVPLIGVPLTAVTMAAAGAMCAFAWPRAESNRSRLFGVTLASTFVAAASVSVIPHAFHMEWPSNLQAPLAFIFGLLAPWVVPAVRVLIPSFFQGLANLLLRMVGAKVGGPQDESIDDGQKAHTPRRGGKEVEREDGD